MDKNKITRRDFIKKVGITTAALSSVTILPKGIKDAFAAGAEKEKKAPSITPEKVDVWKQFAGETVRVLTENTPPSLGIRGAAPMFEKLTGMKVEFTLDFIDPLKEKMFLDLRSGNPQFHVNYAQPKPIGAVMCDYWTPINKFVDIKTGKSLMLDLPDVPEVPPEGLAYAFSPMHFRIGCQYYNEGVAYGLPYDTAMGILFYNKDIIEKYGKKFEDKYGKQMKPDENTTWEDLYIIADFINNDCPEVDYGLGFHYAQGWPINQDYVALLRSYGVVSEGFAEIKDPTLGSRNPGPYMSDKKDYDGALQVLEMMKKFASIIHPDSLVWDWAGLGTAQATGKIAMQVNCGEFCPYLEDPNESIVAGKVGYSVDPKGPAGIHGVELGAACLAIPSQLPEREQKKAWLFVLWATGPQGQWEAFTRYYGTPTRVSSYEQARKEGWLEEDSTFRKAQHLRVQDIQMNKYSDGLNIGPKIPTYTQYLDIVGGELSKLVGGRTKSTKECLDTMISRLNKLHGV